MTQKKLFQGKTQTKSQKDNHGHFELSEKTGRTEPLAFESRYARIAIARRASGACVGQSLAEIALNERANG